MGALALGFLPGAASAATTPTPAPVSTTAVCANAPSTNPFTDLQPSNVHYANILCMFFAGITNGQTATTYNPGGTVTRAQMASFIARFIDTVNANKATGATLQALPASGPDAFTDDNGNTHEANINRLAAVGVVQGGPGGRPATQYGPDLPVSRSQIASFINRAVGFVTNGTPKSNAKVTPPAGWPCPAGQDFFDDDNGDVHECDQNALASKGIIVGNGAGKSNPGGSLQRDQMASELGRAAQVLNNEGKINPFAAGQTPPSANGNGVTKRPDLIAAKILSTTQTNQANGTQGPGTVVRYTFDKGVTAQAPDATKFFVYRAEQPFAPIGGGGPGLAIPCSGANPCALAGAAAPSSSEVDMRFPTLTNDPNNAGSAILTLNVATVRLAAVTDAQGNHNPEGDAPIGITASRTFSSGATDGPDLVSVGTPRAANPAQAGFTPSSTIVDFVFDIPAFVQGAGGGGFHVIPANGQADIACTGPGPNTTQATNPSGGTTPGGNGTTTISVLCGPIAPTFAPPTVGGALAAGNFSRGVVDTGAVGSNNGPAGPAPALNCSTAAAPTANVCNPQEASDTPHTASGSPDLTSVTRVPANNTTDPDVMTFTFDEPIVATGGGVGQVNGAAFFAYSFTGAETGGGTGAAGGVCSNNTAGVPATPGGCPAPQVNGNQVAVFFPNGTMQFTVGGNVRQGGATGANSALANQRDEVGVSNPNSIGLVAGRLFGADLTGVEIRSAVSGFSTGFTIVYTFDAQIGPGGGVTPPPPNPANLFAYLQDGTRMQCAGTTPATGFIVGGSNTSVPLTNQQLACSNYTFSAAPENGPTNASGTASSATVGSAVLGTVLFNTVNTRIGGQFVGLNPEGAEPTTGGTVTPTPTP